ncbi:transcription factor bHLH30-like [Chenopodium quinoa]|uniref:BHLH domain-containing protein n=2 Tax=Chenopodium quinoa TaxID=63459 RepID=A0A803KX96_CHEQI|nr:transcription factor bHLH30-like [Chenopodium quinoa]XP_021728169.1 transcription factor bHLH30-like [Chenopodium quinoa]
MLVNSMASYYEMGNSSNISYPNTNNFLLRPTIQENTTNNAINHNIIASATTISPSSMLCSSSKAGLSPEAKALAACKSHKEAERRRRKRINGHFATLRSVLPNLVKTDKASVLAEVVRRVRELKKATSELTGDGHEDYDGCNACLLPGDIDEVSLRRSENDNTTLIATLCCEDRPELILDLTRALRSVKGKVVKAEMATVGGRTKNVLWVRGVGGGGPEGLLKRALKVVVDKAPSSSGLGHGLRMHRPY